MRGRGRAEGRARRRKRFGLLLAYRIGFGGKKLVVFGGVKVLRSHNRERGALA